MEPDEFNDILNRLDWPLLHLANVVQRNYAIIRKMAAGSRTIDKPLADWLREADRRLAMGQGFKRWIKTPPAKVPRHAPDQLPAAGRDNALPGEPSDP